MINKINEFENKYPRFAEIIRFLIVGLIATAVDMLIMSVIMYLPNRSLYPSYLSVFKLKGVAPIWLTVLATGVGFIVGLVINYVMSLWFVYTGNNKNAKTKKGAILFAFLSSIGLAIQTFGMWLCCEVFNINEWVIKVILVIVVLMFNYITRKIFIFNNKQNSKEIKKELEENNLEKLVDNAIELKKYDADAKTTNKTKSAKDEEISINNNLKNANCLTKTQTDIKEDALLKNNSAKNKKVKKSSQLSVKENRALNIAVENEEQEIVKNNKSGNRKQTIVQIILNLLFMFSCVCYSNSVFRQFSILGISSTIIMLCLDAVILVLMGFYLFFVNKGFVTDNIIYKNKNFTKVELFTITLSVIATFCYLNYIIGKLVGNQNAQTMQICFAALSIFAVFVFFMAAYKIIINKIIWFAKSLTKSEKLFILYSGILFAILFIVTLCCTKIFIGSEKIPVEIYSFDPGYVYDYKPFVDPFSFMNNIRHLLFSYAALPFCIIPFHLFSLLNIYAFFGCIIQILNFFMVAVIIILIKRLIKIENIYAEISFYILAFLSATFLINILVVEKFIFAMFYLVLTLYATLNKSNYKYLYFFLAVSSLSTYLFLFPIVFFDKEKKAKDIFKELIVFAVFFVFAIMLSGEMSFLKTAQQDVDGLVGSYGGTSLKNNLLCYFSFFTQSWLFSNIKVRNFVWWLDGNKYKDIWYADFTFKSPFFYIGIAIFLLILISFFFTRKEKLSKICFYWFIITFIFIVIVGWGVMKNEVFISSTSYFWAFLIPIFMFLNKVFKNKKALLITVSIAMLVVTTFNCIRLVEILKVANEILPTF